MFVNLDSWLSLLVAQNAEPSAGGGLGFFVPIAIMIAVFYFIVLLPQRKEQKARQAMLEALKRGDEVVTSSGLLGKVADIDPRVITLEIDRNVKIRVLRSAIVKRGEDLNKEATSKLAASKSES